MADTTYKEYKHSDGKLAFTAYSRDGRAKSDKEFESAKAQWMNGQNPEGFLFLEESEKGKNLQAVARTFFEDTTAGVRNAAPGLGGTVGALVGSSPLGLLLNKAGIVSNRVANAPMQIGRNIGNMTQEGLRSTIATPENFGATVGGALALGKARGLSNPLQALAAGSGVALGNIAGSAITGSPISPGQALVEGLMAGVTQGAFGVIRTIAGRGMSDIAQRDVSKGLMELSKKIATEAGSDPAALAAYTSTRKGMSEVLQIGIKGLRGDLQNSVDDVLVAVNSRAPHSLSRVDSSVMKKLVEQYYDAANELIDKGVSLQGNKGLQEIQKEMFAIVTQAYQGKDKAQKLAIDGITNSLRNLQQRTQKYETVAELFNALRESGAEKGFNPQAFQKVIQGKFARNPQGAMQEAARIAFRGADPTGGIDRNVIPSLPVPFTRGRMRTPPMGMRYVGQVGSAVPDETGFLAGRAALESFIGSREE